MKAGQPKGAMHSASEIIRNALRATILTRKRRVLFAIGLGMLVAIPTYAAIISNTTYHTVTVQDVMITSSPAVESVNATGFTETGTVTVSSPQRFTGFLTLSIFNSTGGASTINPSSFEVTINGAPVIGFPTSSLPDVKAIAYVGSPTTINMGTTVFTYSVHFISHSQDALNGIQSGTQYQISQVVSQSS